MDIVFCKPLLYIESKANGNINAVIGSIFIIEEFSQKPYTLSIDTRIYLEKTYMHSTCIQRYNSVITWRTFSLLSFQCQITHMLCTYVNVF